MPQQENRQQTPRLNKTNMANKRTLFSMDIGLLIVDEAHEARKDISKLHMGCCVLVEKAEMTLLMTATPVINAITD